MVIRWNYAEVFGSFSLPDTNILGSSVCVMQWTGVIRDVTLI
jgi:hypothetical protein